MTPEAQRIAIAEACGWARKPEFDYPWMLHGEFYTAVMWGQPDGRLIQQEKLPDYLSDLNAMHEAEKTLQHFGHYVDILANVMGLPRGTICTVGASAAQRAEAFLRTICKWEDDK